MNFLTKSSSKKTRGTAAAISTADASRQRGFWNRLLHSPTGIIGLSLCLIIILVALSANIIAPYSPDKTNLSAVYQIPGTVGYPLGTDNLGRDIFTRILFGMRASLLVGVLTVVFCDVIGVPLGLMAGQWKFCDGIISRITDIMLSFPSLIIAVGLAAIRGASLNNVVIALGIAHVPQMIRIVRGEVLRVSALDYVVASYTMNSTKQRTLYRHILRNILPAIIVQDTIIVPAAVLGESVLSFLGLGIQPPTPSLGVMLSDAQQYVSVDPYMGIFPGLMIAVICLSFNILGDAVKDCLQ
ncbi:ABC transporter permease [Bifidobacterium aquikefiri]|uniref:ABC transporter permease n=1 Tax=Bifidobacterium aquikefiri TaxID=1653207 RepID=A0A261G315_9BIFI|nr:ABC transporter permease [Bifidobacterium aquikefiri]OZG65817.1 ABC transporter permease [Bifidobacterium aquikefiri]